MAHRVKLTTLDASSLKIINTIRENASYEYQQNVPVITDAKMIPKVGEIIIGNGSLQNQFLNALMNRIAKVVIESATFNNPYAHLKKDILKQVKQLKISLLVSQTLLSMTQKKAKQESSREIFRT